MPVTATSREAKISEALVNMLANCAAAQAITGTASLAACKAFIIEDYGGERGTFKAVDGSTLNPDATFLMVRLGDVSVEKRARDSYGWSADATITINQLATGGDQPAEKMRRCRNAQGDIRAQIEAQFGSTSPFTALTAGLIQTGPVMLADDVAPNRLHVVGVIPCTLYDLP